MFLETLYLKDFRLFHECCYSFSPFYNIFYGDNGVGKTTLLEAIGYLARGKSFRTTSAKKLIRLDKKSCIITGNFKKNVCSNHVGIEVHRSRGRQLKINGQAIQNTMSLAALAPLLWVNFSNLYLFLAPPALRRQVLNWGVFHSAGEFYTTWRAFNKTLQQRNIALKQHHSNVQVQCWDKDFVAFAETLDQMRCKYMATFGSLILPKLKEVLNISDISLNYSRGWASDVSLEEVLRDGLKNDRVAGYTQFGPHRADISLLVKGKPSQDFCSQGQHKLISYVFYIMQAQLFAQTNQTTPLLLIDDLPSELDVHKLRVITSLLKQLKAQVFISGVNKDAFGVFRQGSSSDGKMFHVKRKETSSE